MAAKISGEESFIELSVRSSDPSSNPSRVRLYLKGNGELWTMGTDSIARSLLTSKNNLNASTNPTVNDDTGDGYSVGSFWYNTTGNSAWICVNATLGAAVWREIGGSGAPTNAEYITKVANGTLTNEFALSTLVTGALQVQTSTGNLTSLKSELGAITNPTVNDDSNDGYAVGSLWVNTSLGNERVYICANAAVGAAVWKEVGGTGGGGGGAPTTAPYVTTAADGGLGAERVLGTEVIRELNYASATNLVYAGALTFVPDSQYIMRSDGSGQGTLYGPIWQLKRPITADFSWVNQSSQTLDTSKGNHVLSGAISGFTQEFTGRVASANNTTHTIECAFYFGFDRTTYTSSQTPGAGLWLSISGADSIFVGFSIDINSATSSLQNSAIFYTRTYTTPTSPSGVAGFGGYVPLNHLGLVWMRLIINDSTKEYSWEVSNDGVLWNLVQDILTYTGNLVGIGFGIDRNDLIAARMNVVHWELT